VRPFNLVAHDLPATSALGNGRRQLLATTGPVREVVCGRTDVKRDFVTADDVARDLARLVCDPPADTLLNLCSGTGTALGAVIDGLAAALGVAVELTIDPVLAALPAPGSVVGDPARLEALGVRLDGSVQCLVEALLQAPRTV
ncbi:MAG: hypothetical protein H7233_14095, partial [Pseudorhodobacter sp.]|nr:hypothetical protein [Frankiaceae bacterium]